MQRRARLGQRPEPPLTLLSPSIQVEVCSPHISHLLSFCCDAFTREQLCNLECLVLLRLNFRLDAPTLAFFLDYYSNRVDAARLEKAGGAGFSVEPIDSRFAQRVCELSLADYAFNGYPPSVVAGSALWLARDLVNPEPGQRAGSEGELDSEGNVPIFPTDENQGVQQTLALECKDKLKLLVSLNKEMLELITTM